MRNKVPFFKELITIYEITLGSLFDGIGGFPYAASFYGVKTLWASEIIPSAISITRRHFPHMEHVGDITKLDGGELAPVDIVTFGSPCQSFSVAGQRTGLEGKSGLFWEAIRVLREMRFATNGKYPKYCIFENVPGILSSNKGRDYKTVLEAFTEAEIPMPPSGRWTNAGMVRGRAIDFAWVIHDAQYFGTAQRRRRLFAVCDFTGQRAAEILFKPKSLHWYFAQGGATREGVAANAGAGVNSAEPDAVNPVAAFMGGQSAASRTIAYNEKVSPTLKSGVSGSNMIPCVCEPNLTKLSPIDGNVYTNDEDLMLNGNKEQKLTVINDQGGNSLTIEKSEISPTLRSEAHGNLPIVGINGDASGTLDANYHKGPGMRGGLEREVVLCAATGQSNAEILENISATLNCTCEQPIVCMSDSEKTMPKAFGICADGSNSMKSANPKSGIYEAETARTIDQNGGNPSCNQGGLAILSPITSDTEQMPVCHPEITGTLCASGAGLSRPAGLCNETDLCIVQKKNKCAFGFDLQQITSKANRTKLKEVQPVLCQSGLPHVVISDAEMTNDPNPAVCGTLCAKSIAPNGICNETDMCILQRPQAFTHLGFGHFAESDVSKTILKNDKACTSDVIAYCLQGSMVGRLDKNGPNGTGVNKNVSYTLNATDKHYVTAVDCRNCRETEEISGTLQSKSTGGYSLNCQNPVRTGYVVRRLIPTECELLMGYPIGWTAYGVPEKSETFRGKEQSCSDESFAAGESDKRKELRRHDGKPICDTARYQALGNSVAIPCVAYVISGIVDELLNEGE